MSKFRTLIQSMLYEYKKSSEKTGKHSRMIESYLSGTYILNHEDHHLENSSEEIFNNFFKDTYLFYAIVKDCMLFSSTGGSGMYFNTPFIPLTKHSYEKLNQYNITNPISTMDIVYSKNYKTFKTLKVDKYGVAQIISRDSVKLDTGEIKKISHDNVDKKLINNYEINKAKREFVAIKINVSEYHSGVPDIPGSSFTIRDAFFVKIKNYKDYKLIDNLKLKDFELVKDFKDATPVPNDKSRYIASHLYHLIENNYGCNLNTDFNLSSCNTKIEFSYKEVSGNILGS